MSVSASDEASWNKASGVMMRSCLLRLLASALGYPTEAGFASMRSSLDACIPLLDRMPRRVATYLGRLAEGVADWDRQRYESEYLRVFSHVCAADCNPHESAFTSKHIFQVTRRLANIEGIYRAFGLETGRERPDHIAVELEFLAFLSYREAIARLRGQRAVAREMLQGQRVFLEHHLGRWVHLFSMLLERKAEVGPLCWVARLLRAVAKGEATRLRVKLPKFDGSIQNLVSDLSDFAPSPLAGAHAGPMGGVFDG